MQITLQQNYALAKNSAAAKIMITEAMNYPSYALELSVIPVIVIIFY